MDRQVPQVHLPLKAEPDAGRPGTRSQDNFALLLARLANQHERDLATATAAGTGGEERRCLEEENQRLRTENKQLLQELADRRGGCGQKSRADSPLSLRTLAAMEDKSPGSLQQPSPPNGGGSPTIIDAFAVEGSIPGELTLRILAADATDGLPPLSLFLDQVVVARMGGKECSSAHACDSKPNTIWDPPEFIFPGGSEDTLEVEVLRAGGEGRPVFRRCVAVSTLEPGVWQRRREQLPDGAGDLNLEMRWQPQEQKRNHEPRKSTGSKSPNRLSSSKSRLSTSKSNRAFPRGWTLTKDRLDTVANGAASTRKGDIPVYAADLQVVMNKKGKDVSFEEVQLLLLELMRIRALDQPNGESATQADEDGDPIITFKQFTELMLSPDLGKLARTDMADKILEMRKALKKPDCSAVIEHSTRRISTAVAKSASRVDVKESDLRLLMILNAVVSVTVIASMVSLGVSLDYWPESNWWLVLEAFFVVVFLAEVCCKIKVVGFYSFFTGEDRHWNRFDLLLTSLSILDLVMSLVNVFEVADMDAHTTRLFVTLRACRLVRIARFIKLLRAPLVRELANMLLGCFIGIRSLFWAMVLLMIFFYVVGVSFRQTVGPEPGQNYMSICGDGDNPKYEDKAQCPIHYLYGEEYFYSVPSSMFTVFRCVLGDCTTRGGKALTAEFAKGYGVLYQLVFSIGMICLVFGLFNVITAVFVDATLHGLALNDAQQKSASLYEQRFTRKKLGELVDRIYHLVEGVEEYQKFDTFEDMTAGAGIQLSETDFDIIMNDHEVCALLDNLDVVLDKRNPFLFDIFDHDSNGSISIPELISTLMKFRGELKKTDMVAAIMALESMKTMLINFEEAALSNQRDILSKEEAIINKEDRILLNEEDIKKAFAHFEVPASP